MKEETERLNKLIDWYKCKLKEINEAPVDSRPRKLRKLYQYSEANKDLGVTITRAGTLALVNYPGYLPELELHEYKDNEENVFYDAPTESYCLLDIDHMINPIISGSLSKHTMVMIQMLLNMLKR